MGISAGAASKLIGNKISEKSTHYNPRKAIYKARQPTAPATDSQRELIARLRGCLNDAGVKNDFIIEPETSYVASHVIRALIRLAKAHGVDTGRRNKSFNGI